MGHPHVMSAHDVNMHGETVVRNIPPQCCVVVSGRQHRSHSCKMETGERWKPDGPCKILDPLPFRRHQIYMQPPSQFLLCGNPFPFQCGRHMWELPNEAAAAERKKALRSRNLTRLIAARLNLSGGESLVSLFLNKRFSLVSFQANLS